MFFFEAAIAGINPAMQLTETVDARILIIKSGETMLKRLNKNIESGMCV
jgi:hypothetical protein